MATITQRGPNQFQAIVRRKGFPTQTKTFESRTNAKKWGSVIESEMHRGVFTDRSECERTTLGEALERYLNEKTKFKRSPQQEISRIRAWQKRRFALRSLASLRSEQCQCDWAHFAHIEIGQAKRPLMAFVMVLSWSRRIFLRFFLGAHMENFLRGHVQAFESWGSVPRVTLYDNLKSAVLERKGSAIRFNPTVLALAAHYHFEPRPVAPARGNQKGRVERAIRYIRTAFFEGRSFTDIDDLNAQADAWVAGASSQRPCPEDTKLTVQQAFEQEKGHLMELPATPFSCDELRAVSAGFGAHVF